MSFGNHLRTLMPTDDRQLAEKLLAIKARAVTQLPWTAADNATLRSCLERGGNLRVLAACCILVSQRPPGCPSALAIVREAVECGTFGAYVELSINEALTFVAVAQLAPFQTAIMGLIRESLRARRVDLVNTVFLVGKLARSGDRQALELLRLLADDAESGVRENATMALSGISDA